jgi:hypothetical protein
MHRMNGREAAYRVLWLVTRNLHGSQAKALIAVASALVLSGVARTYAVADELRAAFGGQFKSACQRIRRLMNNPRLDDLAVWAGLSEYLLSHIRRAKKRLAVVSLDWTEWGDDYRVLALSLTVAKRGIPLFAQAFSKTDMPRSQNARENAFVEVLEQLTPLLRHAILLADRGFHRVSFLRVLLRLEQRFVVRLVEKLTVESPRYRGLLSLVPIRPGQQVDLGRCTLRTEKRQEPVVVRIVAVWQKGQKEPWWLATSESCPALHVAELYDRRMTVEEVFRDTKGCRFGMQMRWTQYARPEALSRLFLLAALALLHWLAAGALAIARAPTARLDHPTKGPRRSLVSIGRSAGPLLLRTLRASPPTVLAWLPFAATRRFDWLVAA